MGIHVPCMFNLVMDEPRFMIFWQNQPLPELTSTDVVRALDNRQSKKYYSGYYPGVNVPDDRIERNKAILIAIGVPAMVAEIAAGEM